MTINFDNLDHFSYYFCKFASYIDLKMYTFTNMHVVIICLKGSQHTFKFEIFN